MRLCASYYLLVIMALAIFSRPLSGEDAKTYTTSSSTDTTLTVDNIDAQFNSLVDKVQNQQASLEEVERLYNQVKNQLETTNQKLEVTERKLELTQWQWGTVGFFVGLGIGVVSILLAVWQLPSLQHALGLSRTLNLLRQNDHAEQLKSQLKSALSPHGNKIYVDGQGNSYCAACRDGSDKVVPLRKGPTVKIGGKPYLCCDTCRSTI